MIVRKNCVVGRRAVTLRGLLGATLLCGATVPAMADSSDQDTLDVSNLERVSDGSMQNLRGGFMVGGFDISFGVTIKTTVNGATVLQTSFNLDNPNHISNLTTTNAADNPATQGAGNVGNWVASQVNNGSGVKMTSGDLATTIVQHFGNGTGFNTDINNTANDRTFSNTTDMNLFLNNFSQVAGQSAAGHLIGNLSNDMAHQSALGN